MHVGVVFQVSSPFDAHENSRRTDRSDGKWSFAAVPPQSEMLAIKEPLAPHRRRPLENGRPRPDGFLRELNTSQSLIDVQCSRLPCLGVNPVPVVEAKS